MDKDMPADWALERAMELANANGANWTGARCHDHGDRTLYTLARHIEAHEQPPVDPDLETAREICARVFDSVSFFGLAKMARDGRADTAEEVEFALAKLKEARGA